MRLCPDQDEFARSWRGCSYFQVSLPAHQEFRQDSATHRLSDMTGVSNDMTFCLLLRGMTLNDDSCESGSGRSNIGSSKALPVDFRLPKALSFCRAMTAIVPAREVLCYQRALTMYLVMSLRARPRCTSWGMSSPSQFGFRGGMEGCCYLLVLSIMAYYIRREWRVQLFAAVRGCGVLSIVPV